MRSLPVLMLVCSPVAAAQQGTSVATLIEPAGRLAVGQETRGALSTADYLSLRNTYLDVWAFDAEAGMQVTIDLMSPDFDPYLYVVGPGFTGALNDDDGGGGCNARLVVTFLERGMFRVIASSALERETGVYTLRLAEGNVPGPSHGCGEPDPAALAALPTAGRRIGVGDTVAGRLSDADRRLEDRPVQAWALEGRAGQQVVITLVSEDFDAYLYLTGPGLEGALTDDDSAGDLDARLEVTLPADGTYRIVAASLRGGGAYRLSVATP